MGHCIDAFLGHNERMISLSQAWRRSPIQLSQGLSMLFLTSELYDEIMAKYDKGVKFNNFTLLNSAIMSVLEEHSQRGKLAYIETDYAGGAGTQAAVLYENGRQKFPPIYTEDFKTWAPSDERAINIILKELGVQKLNGKDEFESIGLGDFRDMYGFI